MKWFIDECLSPGLAVSLCKNGYDAVHPRNLGRRGDPDHVVLRKCLDEDRIIVTHNADDFRGLVGKTEIHPGLVILGDCSKAVSKRLLEDVIAHIVEKANPSPADYMINRVIETGDAGDINDYLLPPIE